MCLYYSLCTLAESSLLPLGNTAGNWSEIFQLKKFLLVGHMESHHFRAKVLPNNPIKLGQFPIVMCKLNRIKKMCSTIFTSINKPPYIQTRGE